MKSKPFKGTNVFMSRNLVPTEVFDSLHDALKFNGAEVFLCCDPSRNSPNDYHVISSSGHEKFEGLKAKGCNLVGPQCVLACAKERRPLPKEKFTCCLAMDGVKMLASGFGEEEKAKIKTLVSAMGGSFLTKPSSDVSFIIVENVIGAKYKWAVHVKKPVVTINWLYQCWNEHRIVPQESYRVPTFLGLIISVTGIPADERRKMEQLIIQNGGRYSADLTRACTHLICNVPEGSKYMVAKTWGHICIVNHKWLDQSIAKRACLPEESYPVQGGSMPSNIMMRGDFTAKNNPDKSTGNSQSIELSVASDSNLQAVSASGNVDSEPGTTLSQNFSVNWEEYSMHVQEKTDVKFDDYVAKHSEDDELYLSDCKISLVGFDFDASETRKLVNMIRKGGGSCYVSCDERSTHIVVGSPSDVEKQELRKLAASGVIYVVQPIWLEDCDRAKEEIPVMQRHVARDVLLPKDLLGSSHQGSITVKSSVTQEKASTTLSSMCTDMSSEVIRSGPAMFEEGRVKAADGSISQHSLSSLTDKEKSQKIQHTCSVKSIPGDKSPGIFTGKLFSFSNSFPQDRRDEVVEWINQGGGKVVDGHLRGKVDFTLECHGVSPPSSSLLQTVHVSSHWVRSCLEDGALLDVDSHMLYSPLPCRVPLPGFKHFRFCVSQYEEKERLLLRNLCFVLGAKFGEKLTKKVSHLLCKFTSGPKYDACLEWGIQPVTCEWIYECIRKDGVVALDSFRPKEPSDRDHEAGLCTVTQYPTQAVLMTSQLLTQSLDLRKPLTQNANTVANSSRKEAEFTNHSSKKPRLLETVFSVETHNLLSESVQTSPHCLSSGGGNMQNYDKENSQVVPDVAAAIEDLLEQTTKIHDPRIPGGAEGDKSTFASDHPVLSTDLADSHTAFGLSKNWLSSVAKQNEPCKPSGDGNPGTLDSFSEAQTESQLVGYEEDLSGRQMIIERVRGSMT